MSTVLCRNVEKEKKDSKKDFNRSIMFSMNFISLHYINVQVFNTSEQTFLKSYIFCQKKPNLNVMSQKKSLNQHSKIHGV